MQKGKKCLRLAQSTDDIPYPSIVVLLESVCPGLRDDIVELVQSLLWLHIVPNLSLSSHIEPVLLGLREVHLGALVHKVG